MLQRFSLFVEERYRVDKSKFRIDHSFMFLTARWINYNIPEGRGPYLNPTHCFFPIQHDLHHDNKWFDVSNSAWARSMRGGRKMSHFSLPQVTRASRSVLAFLVRDHLAPRCRISVYTVLCALLNPIKFQSYMISGQRGTRLCGYKRSCSGDYWSSFPSKNGSQGKVRKALYNKVEVMKHVYFSVPNENMANCGQCFYLWKKN